MQFFTFVCILLLNQALFVGNIIRAMKEGKNPFRYILAVMVSGFLFANAFLFVVLYADDVVHSVTIDAAPPSITSLYVAETIGGSAVTEFFPVEATSTVVYVKGSVIDYDGCSTVDSASNWDIVLYRSGVLAGRLCGDDDNDCYPAVESGNITLSGCDGGADSTLNFSIPVSLAFWADPTDYGAPFVDQNWVASVKVTDDDGNYDLDTTAFELHSLLALGIPDSLDYGSVVPGHSSMVKSLEFIQTGNRAFDLEQTATSAAMTCDGAGSDDIPWSNVEMALSQYFVYGDGVDLSANRHISTLDFAMPRRFDDANPVTKKLYFRLMLPSTGVSGVCSGTVRFTAKASS